MKKVEEIASVLDFSAMSKRASSVAPSRAEEFESTKKGDKANFMRKGKVRNNFFFENYSGIAVDFLKRSATGGITSHRRWQNVGTNGRKKTCEGPIFKFPKINDLHFLCIRILLFWLYTFSYRSILEWYIFFFSLDIFFLGACNILTLIRYIRKFHMVSSFCTVHSSPHFTCIRSYLVYILVSLRTSSELHKFLLDSCRRIGYRFFFQK